MRRLVPLLFLGAVIAAACSSDSKGGLSPGEGYELKVAAPALGVGQDSTVQLDIVVLRGGEDTVKNSRITYTSDDYTVASVSSSGLITGIKAGTTTIRASLSGATVPVTVTVRGRPATSVELTVVPTGDTTGIFYAFPGDAISSQLNGVVRVGTDTVFCNRCANVNTRRQRIVQFMSLDTEKATVSNARNPNTPDTTGRVLAKDTTAGTTKIRVVLSVPADNIADTVSLSLKLRPIDSLEVRPDSFTVAGSSTKQAYPNANVVQGAEIRLGVTFRSRVVDPPAIGSTAPGAVRWIPVFATGTLRRSVLPAVKWESANNDFATVTQDGRITGVRAFYATSGTGSGTVIGCGATTPGLPAAAFSGEGTYSVPNCATPKTLNPRPGVFCSTNNSNDLSSFCEVWIRATATDPVTGRTLTDKIAVIVRR
jgi:hypothetical protein